MRKYALRNLFAAMALVAVMVMAGSGCKKENPTKAIITVIDTIGLRVPGAVVILEGEPSDSSNLDKETRFVDVEGVTGEDGSVMFDFTDLTKPGQAGFVVLDVQASKDGLIGIDVIEIEEEKTTYKTVRIQ